MNARTAAVAGILMVTLAGGLILFIGLPRWYRSRPEASTASPPQSGPVAQQPAAAARKITATLFYVSDDGMTLVVSSTDAMVTGSATSRCTSPAMRPSVRKCAGRTT